MKYLVMLVLGIVCGVAAALAVVYYNPLTLQRPSRLESPTVLRYDLSAPSTLASTHGGSLRVDLKPAEISQLWEATISKTALNVLLMSDENDEPVAIASRMSKLSERTNVVSSGVILADHWLVTIPGRGTFFVNAENNLWPVVRDTLVDIDLLQREWLGQKSYAPTVGPEANGTAAMTGATGEFVGVFGSAADFIELDDYDVRAGLNGMLRGELRLRLMGPASAENAPDSPDDGDTLR